MIVEERQIPAAVQTRVLDLAANLPDRLALPRHLNRRHGPTRMARNALIGRAFVQGKVAVGMAGHAGKVAARERFVWMNIVGLRGAIASRMAVKATRMRQDLSRLCKKLARPFGRIGD
jgi:hypothetical protein